MSPPEGLGKAQVVVDAPGEGNDPLAFAFSMASSMFWSVISAFHRGHLPSGK